MLLVAARVFTCLSLSPFFHLSSGTRTGLTMKIPHYNCKDPDREERI